MEEKDQTARVRSQRPRSPRVPVEFSLEVEGQDKDGNAFRVTARAIKISRGGATIVLDREVSVGSIVTLTPPFGANLRAEVNGAWTDPNDNKLCVGVKLLDPGGWFAE